MKEETKGLYAAVFLSIAIIFLVNYFLPATPEIREETLIKKPEAVLQNEVVPQILENHETQQTALDLDENDDRVEIKNTSVEGSIRLKGARFDLLKLLKYKETLDPNSPDVELLQKSSSKTPYFASFGFLSTDQHLKMPGVDSLWHALDTSLTPSTPLTMEWQNGQGLKFVRRILIDDHYLINITDTVENNSDQSITIYPYGLINRTYDDAQNTNRSVVHEGMSGVLEGSLKEIKLKSIKENDSKTYETTAGWAGFSDRYWFTAFILGNNEKTNIKFSNNGKNNYQVDYLGQPITILPQGVGTHTVRFFAGAKEIKLLDKYTKQDGIKKFDLAIDFGWYYFLTKPFFYILDFLYKYIGNMGWAILLFAALLRLLMFQIANKSYESMSKMRKIQPKVVALQALYKNDKMLLQQKTMELYKKEKVNPASGCLPMFIQIPIFFSLYKVLNIAIEIRHAPFIGWIKDLSAPDPLTISVWSHIPVPSFIDIGIWPIVMGLTMWIQQKLNPTPTNKDQARMFALMPFIFTLMLGHFASGLVIYWTLSNILSIIQQKAIMHKNGVK